MVHYCFCSFTLHKFNVKIATFFGLGKTSHEGYVPMGGYISRVPLYLGFKILNLATC